MKQWKELTNYIYILEIFILLNINNTLKNFINLFEQTRNLIDKKYQEKFSIQLEDTVKIYNRKKRFLKKENCFSA